VDESVLIDTSNVSFSSEVAIFEGNCLIASTDIPGIGLNSGVVLTESNELSTPVNTEPLHVVDLPNVVLVHVDNPPRDGCVSEHETPAPFHPPVSSSSLDRAIVPVPAALHVTNVNHGHGFIDISEDDWKRQTTDFSDNSKKVNMWARNKFDA